MRLLLLFSLFWMLMLSCGSIDKTEHKVVSCVSTEVVSVDLSMKAKLGKISNKIDSVLNLKIKSVVITGNYLEIDFSYRGGCEKHEFDFVGSEKIEKSMPPIRTVQLVQSSVKPDLCKKLIFQKIKIDVTDLAYKKESGSEIFLSIKGWDEKVKYIFEAN